MPDRLFHNDGHGRFVEVTERAGITKADGAGLGVAVGDYNGDGWLDLYVANDATPNQLWINRRDGTFVDQGLISGSALNAAGNPEGSMGIASGDFDLDGDEDLFVTNIVGETSVLYVNDGHGNFDDARARVGLARLTAAFTGFGTDWIDYDNDGWPDLFVANGAVNIVESHCAGSRRRTGCGINCSTTWRDGGSRRRAPPRGRRSPAPRLAAAPRSATSTTTVTWTSSSRTTTGRCDCCSIRRPRRTTGCRSASTSGPATGSGSAPGLAWSAQDSPTLWRRVRTDGSYLSASDVRVHVGLGSSSAVTAVVVQWPDGQRERWTGIAGDRLVTLRRGTGRS